MKTIVDIWTERRLPWRAMYGPARRLSKEVSKEEAEAIVKEHGGEAQPAFAFAPTSWPTIAFRREWL
jgi:hypothetical protein